MCALWRKPKAKRRRTRSEQFLLSLSGGLVPVLSLLLAFLGPYYLQIYSGRCEIPPVIVLIFSPRYLEVHGEEEIHIALENGGNNATQAAFGLVSDGSCPVFIEQEGTNFFFVGVIQKREQIGREVKVFFPFSFSILGQPAGLTLWGSLHNRPVRQIATLPVSTAPIPLHRHIFKGALSLLGAFLIWVFKEWWDAKKQEWGGRK